jgi:hypothetical protein
MQVIEFEITGQNPLLINRFHEEARLQATRGIHERHTDWPEAKIDAAARLYSDPDGKPYFPAENLRQAIITAAARQKIGRRAATSDMAGALYLTPDALPLYGEWTVDERPVVIPATKGRLVRARPRFDTWSIAGDLAFDERLVDMQLVRTCVDQAGMYVGIGDFRPQKKGPYGRFVVTNWNPRM